MQSDTSFPSPPPLPPVVPPRETSVPETAPAPPKPRARWRWWVHLLVIAGFPVFLSLLSIFRYSEGQPKLPSTSGSLVLFCVIEIAVFAAFWVLAWAFSRATKDELWLRWRGGWRPPLQGFGYGITLQLGYMFLALAGFVVLTLTVFGGDSQKASEFYARYQPQTKDILSSVSGNTDPVYRFLIATLLSFGVAGGREELWRAATMAGVRAVCPACWKDSTRAAWALGVAAVVFGLGHAYQGPTGMIATGILGVFLGLITLKHQSVWPAVIAHGFFDANMFWLATSVAGRH